MCWLRKAFRPRVRQIVFFNSAANRENRWDVLVQFHWSGNIATRAAELPDASRHGFHHRIVTAQQNLAVVHKKSIRNARQTRDGFTIINRDGFLAQIGACHHKSRKVPGREEQVMRRRVGKKDADIALERSHCVRDCGSGPPGKQHNGPIAARSGLPSPLHQSRRKFVLLPNPEPSRQKAFRRDPYAGEGVRRRKNLSHPLRDENRQGPLWR